MEGFLSLEQAAEQLQFSVSELSRQIEEGRVVAIVKEGRSWLSAGEVSRLKRQSQRAAQPPSQEPQEELRLLRRSTSEATRPSLAPLKTTPPAAPPEPPALTLKASHSDSELSAAAPPSAATAPPLKPVEPKTESLEANPLVLRPLSPSEPPPLVAKPLLPPEAPALVIKATSDTAPTLAVKPLAPPQSTPPLPPKPNPASASVGQAAPLLPDPEGLPTPLEADAAAGAQTQPPAAAPAAPVAAPAPSAVAAPAAVPAAAPVDDKLAQQLRELNKRCSQLEVRNQEMESTTNRLKAGLQETEATLKRNRVARANLENDVIALQDQLSKARTRNEALEREIQHLGAELERNEDAHNSEIRRMRSNKGERAGEESSPTAPAPGPASAEMEVLRNQMSEKDRLLAQEYEQRATLRSQLEDKQQKYFELKARYDKEKSEWSELLAQALQNQGQLRQQLEEMKAKNLKGWNPFRREK